MSKTKGRVTLPSQSNFLKETQELMERWGADALRDSDGTKLDAETKALDAKIYTTYFVARGHNQFAQEHMEACQQLYLMSKHNLATDTTLTISFTEGYFVEQVKVDYDHDPKRYWEVIDRTTAERLSPDQWSLDPETDTLTIQEAVPFHDYTVSFLVYAIWDPTQMYNHITNNWGEKPHEIPFDVRNPEAQAFMKTTLRQWLRENPDTDVVRFTTFFYHFTLVFNHLAKEKFVDWFGYGASVSVAALDAFEEEMGYRLRAEDIVDQGYYNSSFRVPTKAYRDYMDFTMRFVAKQAKELVDIVHEEGREAMMFLGDNWIGTEPYGPYFESIGLDAVVGSVGGGATLRMISDIPHVRYTEGRFLPYFFPDTFYEGNDPVPEAKANWLSARRAILRSPVDRIGYGGYLSLAYAFPSFVDYIEQVTDEYREIYEIVHAAKPYTGLNVGILNAWGSLRTWQTHMVAHALPYKQIYSYLGILESLSGAAVQVRFLSFDEVMEGGVPSDIDVIINAGDADTAFSGGAYWDRPELLTAIRSFVYNGGGFVGVGEPSALDKQGRYFQLADVLGVDKERGFSLSTDKYFNQAVSEHFLTQDMEDPQAIDFGEGMKNVYATEADTQIVTYKNGEVLLSSHSYGQGRGVYLAGLPYSPENSRLLLRALYHACNKEVLFSLWNTDNKDVEVHAYPDQKKFAVVNNEMEARQVVVTRGDGSQFDLHLDSGEIRWFAIE